MARLSILIFASFALAVCSNLPKDAAEDAGRSSDAAPIDGADGGTDSGQDAESSRELGCDECTTFVGRFFDGEKAMEGAVVVRGATIEAVHEGPRFEVVAGAERLLEDATLIPGLFDLHVHMSAPGSPHGHFPTRSFTEDGFRAALGSGVTSLLDLGTQETMAFEYRRRQREDLMLAPRLFASGPLLTPSGGHPCYEGSPARACRLVDSVEDVERELPDLLEAQPDVVKVVVEGGTANWSLPRVSTDVLGSIAAGAGSTPVIAHVSSPADIEDALDAGVRAFAHMPGAEVLSPATVDRLAQEGAYVIATLAVYDGMVRLANEEIPPDDELAAHVPGEIIEALHNPLYTRDLHSPSYREWAQLQLDNARENFRLLHAAGVTILVGTDAGNPMTFHGLAVARELELFVELGMSNVEALNAATAAPAQFLAVNGGRLEVGEPADLVIVGGNPLDDVAAIADVRAVFRAGEELDLGLLDVRQDTDLTRSPIERDRGQACFRDHECGPELSCAPWDYVCADSCDVAAYDCEGGVCWESEGGGGYCEAGNGCDLFAQDCANGAPCVFLGNGATYCYFAYPAEQGDACGPGNACAAGYQCNFQSGTCAKLCDPSAPTPECPPETQCYNASQVAGMTVGLCV